VRFLVDESLPRAVTRALAAGGHDAVDVRDIMRGAQDDEIATHAKLDSRIVITADLDFSNALRFPPGTHPGMLIARVPSQFAPEDVGALLVDAIDDAGPAVNGAITVVEPGRVRIFRGP
jgi:predicted nuclease of predicted toxin-antitoxin system